MRRRLLPLILVASACSARSGPPQRIAAAETAAAEVRGLENIQRTMRLLAESTPERRNKVRILFYGQSITESPWSRRVAEVLRRRYPHADLEIENRALGGHAAQLLVKAAESDLYPFYPDLMIFHVLGAHDSYEQILRRVRERTTAEVLHQTDHVFLADDLDEPRDPAVLRSDASRWSAFMNHAFLPRMQVTYRTALCDQREAWKRYLRTRQLAPQALLSDDVHLNGRGDDLMSTLVEGCLRRAPELDPSPAERWVTTLVVGRDVHFRGDTLELSFEGNRIDVITEPDSSPDQGVTVLIDGVPPSSHASLYGFSRAHAPECGKWPPVFDIGSRAPLLLEAWTLRLSRLSGGAYAFTLFGSRTGEDGGGRSDRPFVSRSGRVVIEPDDWNLDYALKLARMQPAPEELVATFRVEPRFVDTFAGARSDPARERVLTLAAGLPSGVHRLTLVARNGTPVRALRVYSPPLTPAAE